MENHGSNGQGSSHDDSHTEGNKQYYPRGWWVPLVGLVVIALGFTLLGGFVFSVSGTDKWGKTEQCDNEKCCNDPNCKGDKCDDKKCDDKCADKNMGGGAMMNDKKADSAMANGNNMMKDSTAKPADHK